MSHCGSTSSLNVIKEPKRWVPVCWSLHFNHCEFIGCLWSILLHIHLIILEAGMSNCSVEPSPLKIHQMLVNEAALLHSLFEKWLFFIAPHLPQVFRWVQIRWLRRPQLDSHHFPKTTQRALGFCAETSALVVSQHHLFRFVTCLFVVGRFSQTKRWNEFMKVRPDAPSPSLLVSAAACWSMNPSGSCVSEQSVNAGQAGWMHGGAALLCTALPATFSFSWYTRLLSGELLLSISWRKKGCVTLQVFTPKTFRRAKHSPWKHCGSAFSFPISNPHRHATYRENLARVLLPGRGVVLCERCWQLAVSVTPFVESFLELYCPLLGQQWYWSNLKGNKQMPPAKCS